MRTSIQTRLRLRPVGFRPWEISSLVQRSVIEEHASEAAFLRNQRTKAEAAPHYKLKHLAMLDERLLAHLQGLRVASHFGWRAAQAGLDLGDPGAVFVTAYLAFASGDTQKMRQALYLGLSQPSFHGSLEAALGWLNLDEVRGSLDLLLQSSAPAHRRVALAALVAHCVDPGDVLARALEDSDAPLRARALRAVGELKRTDLCSAAKACLNDPDLDSRFWASWSLAIMGESSAAEGAIQAAQKKHDHIRRALLVSMRCGRPQWARECVRALAGQPATMRQAIQAAGAFGDPAVIAWLLDHMTDPLHARVAGEAFSMITGADLDYLGLKRDAPEEKPAEAAPEDENLPWPNLEALIKWWDGKRDRFARGQRYLTGQPVSTKCAIEVLRNGYQRQRQAATIELARLSNAEILFLVADRADRQRRRLAA